MLLSALRGLDRPWAALQDSVFARLATKSRGTGGSTRSGSWGTAPTRGGPPYAGCIFPLLTERSGDILSSVTDRRDHEQTIRPGAGNPGFASVEDFGFGTAQWVGD